MKKTQKCALFLLGEIEHRIEVQDESYRRSQIPTFLQRSLEGAHETSLLSRGSLRLLLFRARAQHDGKVSEKKA